MLIDILRGDVVLSSVVNDASFLTLDGFDAFVETGNCFDPEAARRVKDFIYSAGGSIDPAAAFRAFRGRYAVVVQCLVDWSIVLTVRLFVHAGIPR